MASYLKKMGSCSKSMGWKTFGRVAGRLRKKPTFPIDWKNIRSALVIRPDRLGDVVLSIPVYESIKRSFPHIQTVALVNKAYAQIFNDNPFVDEVLGYDPRRPWLLADCLNKRSFDLALTLNKKFSAGASVMAWLSGATYKAGYLHEENSWLQDVHANPESKPRHEILNNLELLKVLSVPEIVEQPQIYFSTDEKNSTDELLKSFGYDSQRPLILMKMGSRVREWGWAPEKFIAVVEKLLENDATQIAFIVGPGEADEVQFATKNMHRKPWILPALSIKKLAALIAKSRLLFCNHTGIMHLASATQTPTLVIFKHGEIRRWGLFGNRHIILEERGTETLAPEIVLDAIDQLLHPTSNPSSAGISE